MLREKLTKYRIILASGSPRRQAFFKELDLDFIVKVKEIEESYPPNLTSYEITDYLSQCKAEAFTDLQENDLLITSDTIVWLENEALGKPENAEGAKKMLRTLSGKRHEVITSVCFTQKNSQITVNETTQVWFRPLTEQEIDYYVNNFRPFDKAGSYGIQEWIGYVGIEKIEGSYFNVMGLPTLLVYDTLNYLATS